MLTIIKPSQSHNLFAMITSKVIDHYNKYSNNNKEILQELPRCDAETRSEQTLLKVALIDQLGAGVPQTCNLQKKKNAVSAKLSLKKGAIKQVSLGDFQVYLKAFAAVWALTYQVKRRSSKT